MTRPHERDPGGAGDFDGSRRRHRSPRQRDPAGAHLHADAARLLRRAANLRRGKEQGKQDKADAAAQGSRCAACGRRSVSQGRARGRPYRGENTGAGERTRTADLLITNQLLYQLSYAGIPSESMTCEHR